MIPRLRRHPSGRTAQPPLLGRVLVVSEDPSFVDRVRAVAQEEGGTVIACLGPAASPCVLDQSEICPLARRSTVAIVDTPSSGAFRYHLTDVPAHDYAERLQDAHPQTHVVLIASPSLAVNSSGTVAVAGDRDEGLGLLTWMLRALAVQAAEHNLGSRQSDEMLVNGGGRNS